LVACTLFLDHFGWENYLVPNLNLRLWLTQRDCEEMLLYSSSITASSCLPILSCRQHYHCSPRPHSTSSSRDPSLILIIDIDTRVRGCPDSGGSSNSNHSTCIDTFWLEELLGTHAHGRHGSDGDSILFRSIDICMFEIDGDGRIFHTFPASFRWFWSVGE